MPSSSLSHFFFDDSPWFKLIELDETPSTNSFLAEYTPLREVEMTLVTAEHQTSGRGQKGNTWESMAGQNLLFSIMVHPRTLAASETFVLSEAIALAIKHAIDRCLQECNTDDASSLPYSSIKWPNDIYVGKDKIAGILIENDLSGRAVERSIIGCGININQTEFHFPLTSVHDLTGRVAAPTSLAQLTSTVHDRRHVLELVMAEFQRLYRLIAKGERESLHSAYMQALYHRDGLHRYMDAAGEFEARISAIEPTGHLHLTDTSGCDRRYAFKEVGFIHED
ncbi:MAG: biotin--[acetyl-CoA-carboxylase] ligase [Bacteroidaceae bacterium]|nr:biotin--[acetyl-CoA-carboxylase] ligase [Bacteroidaceae bacterium]